VSSPVNGAQSTFTFTAKEPGWDGVECQLHDDKGDIVPASKSAVAALVTDGVPHTPGDPYLYGCCAHLLFKPVAQSDKEIAMMKSAGFGACRMDFDWGKLEPTEGTYNWTRMDDIFAKLAAAQIAPAPMVGYTARWASTGDTKSPDFRDWMMAAPAPDKYVAFLKTAVARYQGKALSWEIWNEPDLSSWRGTPDQYADLLGSAVAGAHEVDPHAIVTNGGISERYEFKTNFTPNFLAKATSHPDIFSYHSHGPLENLLVANARVREMTKGAGLQNLTLWLNEAGFSCTICAMTVTKPPIRRTTTGSSRTISRRCRPSWPCIRSWKSFAGNRPWAI